MRLHRFATISCSLPAHQAWSHSAEALRGTELAWQPLKRPQAHMVILSGQKAAAAAVLDTITSKRVRAKERQLAHFQVLHQMGLLPQHLPAGSTP